MAFTAIYPGRLQIKADLLLLSKCFESLGQFDSNGEITANCVLITRRGEKHHGDPDDWVYRGENVDGVFQFFGRKNAGLDLSRPCQRKTAVLHSRNIAFWFTAYIFDDSGKTPCRDPELLQDYQTSIWVLVLLKYSTVFEKLQSLQSRLISIPNFSLALQRDAHTDLDQTLIGAGRQALKQTISGLCNRNITDHPQINAIFEQAGMQIQLTEVLSLGDNDRVRESYLNLCDVTLTKLSGAMELLVKSLRIED